MPFLRSVGLRPEALGDGPYPWDLPVVRALRAAGRLELSTPVTMLVGENGSGKSTLVEAVAVALGLNAEGGTQNFRFSTRESHSPLHEALVLSRGAVRERERFFLRAESLFTVATQLEQYADGSPAVLEQWGGSLHEQSHGESFLSLVSNRLGDDGLYLLDEPEAALSPQGLLALMTRMAELVAGGSQFLVATHSPILLAFPGATIYELDGETIAPVAWGDAEHVRLTKAFLEAPGAFLRHLAG